MIVQGPVSMFILGKLDVKGDKTYAIIQKHM